MSGRRSRAATMRRRARRRRERRRMLKVAAITASAAVTLSAVLVIIGVFTAPRPTVPCIDRSAQLPGQGISGWRGDQLENAVVIIRTARGMGLDREAQVVGVMAAMGESSLHNIDHGDWETSGATNPDGSRTTSIGLFQQQAWWGSVDERMDPETAAARFFARLQRLPDWRELSPSHAINRVQINSDREHYARFEEEASEVVDALSGECAR
ncbi:hypothetical protein ACFWHT_13210 [Microbacterium sp. NPDC058342]|uniref:hypothetical protein n=1 Tax=Microbacterium sp. NPDC058342 TaxID=3346454 RepID=UPI0036693C97